MKNWFQRDIHQSAGKIQRLVIPCWTLNCKLKKRSIELQTSNLGYLLTDLIAPFNHFNYKFSLSISNVWGDTLMGSSASTFALVFRLSDYRQAPDPLAHSFFTFITYLWAFETLILVWSINIYGNKQRNLCFSTANEETSLLSFANITWYQVK